MEEETLDSEVLNSDENLDSNQETEEVDAEAKLSKAEEIAKNQRIRAEKAEKELKALKEASKEKETPKTETYRKEQILESRALNSLHEDDIEQVVRIAEANKVSLSEAIKDPYVKSFLKTREEERKTAEATATKTTRASAKTGEAELTKKADSYQLDPSEMKDAAKAMINEVFGKK